MNDREQLRQLGEVKPARPTFKPGPPHPERVRLWHTREAFVPDPHKFADHLGCDAAALVSFENGDLTLAITPDEYRDEIARCRLGLAHRGRSQSELQES